MAILYNGKSLLPAGVVKVSGDFHKGDVVEVFGVNGILGKGEVSYSSGELRNAIEDRNKEKEGELVSSAVEVIHRDRWAQI